MASSPDDAIGLGRREEEKMSYIEKGLLPGEHIVYSGKLHWFIFLPAIFWLIVAVVLCVISQQNQFFSIASAVVALYALYAIMKAIIIRWTTELGVTNKRIIFKKGVIRRDTMELTHGKIESIREEQGIIDRIFDRGSLVFEGTGGGKEYLKNIDAPLTFKKNAQFAADQAGTSGGMANNPAKA